MKKTTTLLATRNSPALNTTGRTENLNGLSGKTLLRHAIQTVLMLSVLVSGLASAVLVDHGPADRVITFPQWYRDDTGLALGLCRSATDFCFPLDPNPAGYVGNIGDEAFYNLVEFKGTTAGAGGNPITGTDFEYRYLGGLEASYLPGPTPNHGDEVVFARIRITFNFNDRAKEGTYVVTHPYGVHTFTNVKATTKTNMIGGNASMFFTIDAPIGIDSVLTGPVGPFIRWDKDLPLFSGTDEFVGDPKTLHTFTGSPFGTNYLKIQGPVGSKLDGVNDFIQVSMASVLGQVWTAPIAQPLKVDEARLTRTAATTSIDVWATSSAGQRLVVTGEGMTSLQLQPEGTVPGKYYGHIEYANTTPAKAAPTQIKVSNLSSNPAVSASLPLNDIVKISHATFNTLTRQLTLVAHSSDQVTLSELRVAGISGLPSAVGVVPAVSNALTSAQCSNLAEAAAATDRCLVYLLPDGEEPPAKVSVISTTGGVEIDVLLATIGGPQNPVNPLLTSDLTSAINVTTAGISNISLHPDARIIQQPVSGVMTLNAGHWIFTPKAGIVAGTDSFTFVIKTISPPAVSNLATGNLNVEFKAFAATAKPDQFAAQTTVARTVDVLGNDAVASVNSADALNRASVTIEAKPTKGNVLANTDGTVTYKATSAGVDTFTYTVKTAAGQISQPATVTVTNFTSPETVNVVRAKLTKKGGWVIDGSTDWIAANLTELTVTCWNGVGVDQTTGLGTAPVIGTTPIETSGLFTIQTGADSPVIGVLGSTIRCQTSSGGFNVQVVQ